MIIMMDDHHNNRRDSWVFPRSSTAFTVNFIGYKL